ncbi:Atp-Binding Cassette Sub-Family F Member 2, partial [Manis pentadactyla]
MVAAGLPDASVSQEGDWDGQIHQHLMEEVDMVHIPSTGHGKSYQKNKSKDDM